VSAVPFDPLHHIGSAEIDGAAAAQGRGVLDEHDLFVVAQPLEDILGLDEAADDLLLAGRAMGGTGTGAVFPARGRAGAFGDGVAQGVNVWENSRRNYFYRSFFKASRKLRLDQSRAPTQFQIIRPWRPITNVLGMPLTS